MSSGPTVKAAVVDTPKPVVVRVVERGPQGLSAFATWKASQDNPNLTEQDFYNYIASLVPSSGGGGLPQRQYSLVNASDFTASHSFPYKPSALLLTASGEEVETDTYYTSGQVRLVFPAPFTGVLYLG